MSPDPSASPVQSVRWVDRAAVVQVVGDIDLSRSNEFQQSLLGVLDQRPDRMVIDLGGVPYMDSSGVASLVKLLGRARKCGTAIYLVQLRERVRSIFEITRLDNVFTIRATEKEALD